MKSLMSHFLFCNSAGKDSIDDLGGFLNVDDINFIHQRSHLDLVGYSCLS